MTPPAGHDPTYAPGLAGWRVDLDSRGTWIATRRATLTDVQREFGVPHQVLAEKVAELEVKAIAADYHATMVSTAERIAARMLAQELERRDSDEKAGAGSE